MRKQRFGDLGKNGASGFRVSFQGDENVLKIDCGDSCTTANIPKKQ